MKILFGPYGCLLKQRGIFSYPLSIHGEGAQAYRLAVEVIAKEYLIAGATLPTVNAFFLRSLLHQGNDVLYQELLKTNIEALLNALGDHSTDEILICLGPAQDCYRPELAPDVYTSYQFAFRQYRHCLKTTEGDPRFTILHETIGTTREALGIAIAARSLNLPLVISFVVDPEGDLLDGTSLEKAITWIDSETDGFVRGYAINCCSPFAFEVAVEKFVNPERTQRLMGFYPNSWIADPRQYENNAYRIEPDKQISLQKIVQIGRQYHLQWIGGCCGFDSHDIHFLL